MAQRLPTIRKIVLHFFLHIYLFISYFVIVFYSIYDGTINIHKHLDIHYYYFAIYAAILCLHWILSIQFHYTIFAEHWNESEKNYEDFQPQCNLKRSKISRFGLMRHTYTYKYCSKWLSSIHSHITKFNWMQEKKENQI